MFCTDSAVRQLKPELILQHVLEAEERQWSTVHLGLDSDDCESTATSSSVNTSTTSDCHNPGLVLLRHGVLVRKIHDYFSQLEFRKCCLHLAGRKSTFQSMRVVHSSQANPDDGSAKRSRASQSFVTHLEDKELRAFKHAYLCAACPVLAAPDPPSPFSPSPVSHPGSHQRSAGLPASCGGAVTPCSPHDSGLEESEDLAFIPSESICTHLQRAFHLTDEKFCDYRYLINKTYVKKSALKLLAEELAGQLAVLENNCHPFYRPHDFLSPHGYEAWRQVAQAHITELLGKFWHFSLPFPRNAQDLMAELHSVHQDYSILLNKLLQYERPFHQPAEEEAGGMASPLSSASMRLLKEFGLRYGVGELFQRILYLDQISVDFSPTLWYLRHVLSVLNSVADLMPASRRNLAMVNTEYEMLQRGLLRLATQTAKALEQMKSVFPGNKPAGGVELLIMVLQRVRDLRVYLQTAKFREPPPLQTALREIIQGLFFKTYEKCKTVIRTELKQSRDIHVCPRMLNAMIMEIRNEVLDYRNNFDGVFKTYFDITVMAAKALYSLLMKDVDTLCQQEKLRDNAIDLRMLALVYRLNQLDHDWSSYISTQDQVWRQTFQPHVVQWCVALGLHLQDLVLETIAGDAFVTQQIQMSSESSPPLTSSSSSPHTVRSVSLTPSINSAFSCFGSAPAQGSSLGIHHLAGSLGQSCEMVHRPAPTPTPTPTLPDTPSVDTEHTGDFLSLADKRHHCASLPLFSDHPAIVRVVSEVKMSQQMQVHGLHSAAAVEDLRGSGDNVAMRGSGDNVAIGRSGDNVAMRGSGDKVAIGRSGDNVAVSQTEASCRSVEESVEQREAVFPPLRAKEQESCILDTVSDYEEMERAVRETGGSIDSEVDSDSQDDSYAYPPVHEVTDLSFSDHGMSNTESAPTPQQPDGDSSGKRKSDSQSRLSSSPSHAGEAEEDGQTQGTVDAAFGGRQSCPLPHAWAERTSGADCVVSEKKSDAFRPDPQRPRPAGVSAFRKVSSASMATDSEHQFLQSVQSTVSFPIPTLSHDVIIPVSGSTIDLIVLLQRTLGFGRSLCQAVFPVQQGVEGVGIGGEGAEAAALASLLESSHATTHLNIVKVLCGGLGIYADNMLCLDLCAVPKNIAHQVIGSTLVDHTVRQQRAGRIWGCRHQLEGRQTCFAFHNRRASFLSERYEPITQRMCVRINNLMSCLRFLDWCSGQTLDPQRHSPPAADAVDSATGGREASSTQCKAGEGDSECMGGSHRMGEGECMGGGSFGLEQQSVEETRLHLMSVWTALCRLLAFRINLFLRDGLTLLLSLKPPSVSIATCLLPVTTFLRSHLDALSSWLYRRSFRRVIEFLWVYIVQDIEMEASKLGVDSGQHVSPHDLLHALTHLMRFMNNCEKGITRELLLSQADDVITKLQLFTLSTVHLIALHQQLVDIYSEGDLMVEEDCRKCKVPVRALHQLHRDLQTRGKCFRGAQLVAWILRNADLFLSADELSLCGGRTSLSAQGAAAIAQQLLELQLIRDVEAEHSLHSRSSSQISVQQYPEVSVHDQLQAGLGSRVDTGTGYHGDNDQIPTPTALHQPQTLGTVQVVLPSPSKSFSTLQYPHGDQALTKSSPGQSSSPDMLTEGSAGQSNSTHLLTPHLRSEPTTKLANTLAERMIANKTTVSAEEGTATGNKAQTSEGQNDTSLNVFTGKDNRKDMFTETGRCENVFTDKDGYQNTFTDSNSRQSLPTERLGVSDFEDSGVAEGQESYVADDPGLSVHAGQGKRDKPGTATAGAAVMTVLRADCPPGAAQTATSPFPSENESLDQESVYDLDMSSICGTPLPFTSVTPFQNMRQVFDNNRFYFLPPQTPSGLPLRHRHHHPTSTSTLSPLQRSLLLLKNSEETCSLAEKCFTLKVTPMSILMVLYARRKTDDMARGIIQRLPSAVLEHVRAGVGTQRAECAVL